MDNSIFYGKGENLYNTMITKLEPLIFNKKPLIIEYDEEIHQFKHSNKHCEVNMEFIGTKGYWIEIFRKIKNKEYIVCLNFDKINQDILPVFYLSIQNRGQCKFILLTEGISFINNRILCYFTIVRVEKDLEIKETILEKQYKDICQNIIKLIVEPKSFTFTKFRASIYTILTANLNINDCIWYIMSELNKKKRLSKEFGSKILPEYFEKYSGKTIYNLEYIFMMMFQEFQKKDLLVSSI